MGIYGFMMVLSVVAGIASIVTMFTVPEFKIQYGVVLITGASSGIGRHAAQHLADEGYYVYAGVRKQSDYDAIASLNNRHLQPLILDVTNHESCVQAIAKMTEVTEQLGKPFVALVNNAGISRRKTAEFHELSDIRAVFETNFFGMVDLTQVALPLVRKHQGRIVMISSVAGVFGSPLSSVYSASKFAMEGFSDGLRRELRSHNVSVSIVQPAYVKSAIFEKSIKINEEVFSNADVRDEVVSTYPVLYSEKAAMKRKKGTDGASPPTVTSEAIHHAIRSRRPLTRYPVANFNGIPAQVIVHLLRLLPDYTVDFLFTVL